MNPLLEVSVYELGHRMNPEKTQTINVPLIQETSNSDGLNVFHKFYP